MEISVCGFLFCFFLQPFVNGPLLPLTDKIMFPRTLAANIPRTFREHSANTCREHSANNLKCSRLVCKLGLPRTLLPRILCKHFAANTSQTLYREYSANTLKCSRLVCKLGLPRTLCREYSANTLPRTLRKHFAANTPQTHFKIFSVPYADIMNSTYFIYDVYIAVHKDIKTLIFLKHILWNYSFKSCMTGKKFSFQSSSCQVDFIVFQKRHAVINYTAYIIHFKYNT